MTMSIPTLKTITAAATVGIVVACGAAPESGVSSIDAGDRTGSQTTSKPDPVDDPVPWGKLLDGDRIERTHDSSPTGCTVVDTLLPC